MNSAYAVEAYLRLNGIEAKEHPVFEELARVKQYFAKIKNIENPDAGKRDLVVDKEAAARMIKHGLVKHLFTRYSSRLYLLKMKTGNDKIDQERAARQNIQFSGTHIKLDESSNKRSADDMSTGETSASTPKKTKKVKGDKPKKEKSKRGQKKGG